MNGLKIQWGHVENTNYIGQGLVINFMSYTSNNSYIFSLFGIDSSFRTSTTETAYQVWEKSPSSITYKTQIRDVPAYKSLDWYAKGY